MQINPCLFRLISEFQLWPAMFPCTYSTEQACGPLFCDLNSGPPKRIIHGTYEHCLTPDALLPLDCILS